VRTTVAQLNNYIKAVFDAEVMLHNIEVVGEISGMSWRGSAVYFSLKDEEAVIQCVSYHPAKFSEIKNGEKVVVRGRVSYWHKAGKINFTAVHVEKFGLGALFLAFEKLRAKLESEGLFDATNKRPLPQNPKRIGVITSPQGAVIHDIIKVAHRRNPSLDIVLHPAQVQGLGSEKSIVAGIEFFCRGAGVDLIILARGGGSAEDLAAFNSEIVARAVANCTIPIVSAVGHETDWTLVDFVSDMRAPTPSAAAEICVPIIVDRRDRVRQLFRENARNIEQMHQQVMRTTTSSWRATHTTTRFAVENRTALTEQFAARVDSSNPLAVLGRGFSKILTPPPYKTGDKIRIRMYTGEIKATIEEVTND